MKGKGNKLFSVFSLVLPIAFGFAVIAWLIMKDYRPGYFSGLKVTYSLILGIVAGFIFIIGRDAAAIVRYHLLADGELSWKRCFYVNTLCEFTSSVTPSAIGGSGLIVIFLNREVIQAGRSLTIMMICVFFDELVLTVFMPIIMLFYPAKELYGSTSGFSDGLTFIFSLMYVLIALYTFMLYLALFRCPQQMKRFFMWISRFRICRKWQNKIAVFADDLLTSANEMRGKSFGYWVKTFLLTTASWTSRYLVVNALLFAFSCKGDQLLAFMRQLVLWITQMVSPTPGGSGISEYIFQISYASYFDSPGEALVATFIWRIITFYLYLVLGVLIISGKIYKRKI